jgi:ATP-dependent DNA ligase
MSQLEPDRLYPPRALSALNPGSLRSVAGFVAQYKYNDIRTLIHLLPDGRIDLRTRQREPVKEYDLTFRMRGWLSSLELDPDLHHVLDGGILRHFTARGEAPIVLWDVLVHDGKPLIGERYRDRYTLLRRICREPNAPEQETGREVALQVRGALWMAGWHTQGYEGLFARTRGVDFLEGLMLKDPGARLEPGTREENNARWQLKVRKPRAGYPF